MKSPPVLPPRSDKELVEALAYYAERASLVNPYSASRRELHKLLCAHDRRVVRLLVERKR